MAGPTWRSRPVFVTSTFRDMHAERDHLRDTVFPALEERLKERYCHLEPVDLRWGVETVTASTSEAKEQLVLKVCLGEIERCRPFLVGLLGDRYGWIPPEQRMRSAAEEAGHEGKVAGKSVTALEIEFGVLASRDQRKRSRFYFREPLAYDTMDPHTAAHYSDLHSPDDAVRAGHAKLQALKNEIREAMQRWGMPERVRSYAAAWDGEARSVVGLDAWGRQVLEDLWCDLEEETRPFAGRGAATWQDEERVALEDFVERGCRDFRGREALLAELEGFALAQGAEGAAWGLCLTGVAGSGKSAVVAMLSRRLAGKALVLMHAAGISPRSAEEEGILRRWTQELAQAAGVPDPTPDLRAREDLERAFASHLAGVARTRRVVCLLDALDQLGHATSTANLIWLPRIWPENVRLVTTAIPGVESEALGARPGVTVSPLPPLDGDEAGEVVAALCARHRKTLHPEIAAALLAKRRVDGEPASGNALWLTLALDELLLLDEDDFARAERAFSGTPEQKLHALLLDTAARLPVEVESLYEYLFRRNERIHGPGWAGGFARLIAASRRGLRESDLEALLPQEANAPWEPLRFAALRRSFRAHLVARGALVQWDFFHAQMRAAVWRLYLSRESELRRVHRAIANHLDRLPREDALRQSELMLHLVGADERLRAARHYGDATLTAEEDVAATHALALSIIGAQAVNPNPGLEWTLSLPALPDLEPALLGRICRRFTSDLDLVLANNARVETRLALLRGTTSALDRLAASDPTNSEWQANLAASHQRMGDALRVQGDAASALSAHRNALAITERLAASDPTDATSQHDLAVGYGRIGRILLTLGDAAAALAAYRASLAIAARMAESDSSNAEWQTLLATCHEESADVLLAQGDAAAALDAYRKSLAITERLAASDPSNEEWQRDVAVDQNRVGDVLLAQGDAAGALAAFRRSLAISERLVEADPRKTQWQRDVGGSHERIGDVLLSVPGDAAAALDAYRKGLAIAERLVSSDPTNTEWQRDLAVNHNGIGEVLLAQRDAPGALAAYRSGLAVVERLAAADPANAQWQHDLSLAHNKIGDALLAQGDVAAALMAYRAGLAVRERLAELDPTNAGWRRGLSVSQIKIGDALLAQGDGGAALDAYRKSLAIGERLAASDPSNAEWQRDLAVGHSGVGDLLQAQGETGGALAAYRRCVAILERLAESDATNVGWLGDLATSHEKIGAVLLAQGNGSVALAAYRHCLAIRERLAVASPASTEWQRDLAASRMRVADLLLAHGDTAAALAAYADCLDLCKRLAASDPATLLWQQHLAASHMRIGDVLLVQGDSARALDNYRDSLAAFERMAASDPTNVGWQRDLAISHEKTGDALLAQGDAAAALTAYRSSHASFGRLVALEPGNADWQLGLSLSCDKVGALHLAQGDCGASLAAFHEGLAIRERLAASDPANATFQRSLAQSHSNLAGAADRSGDTSMVEAHLRLCRQVLRGMRDAGAHLDPPAAQMLEQLDGMSPDVSSGDARQGAARADSPGVGTGSAPGPRPASEVSEWESARLAAASSIARAPLTTAAFAGAVFAGVGGVVGGLVGGWDDVLTGAAVGVVGFLAIPGSAGIPRSVLLSALVAGMVGWTVGASLGPAFGGVGATAAVALVMAGAVAIESSTRRRCGTSFWAAPASATPVPARPLPLRLAVSAAAGSAGVALLLGLKWFSLEWISSVASQPPPVVVGIVGTAAAAVGWASTRGAR